MPGLDSADVSFAVVNAATGADREVVAAKGPGLKIVVVGFSVSNATLATHDWKSGTTVIAKNALAASTPDTCSVGLPCFETAANQALNINASAGTVLGWVAYVVQGA